MNQRCWGLPLGGIKSSMEIVCFQVVPERVKCIWWTDRVRKGIPNHWCSCMEVARTESKVSARDLQEVRRRRWPVNSGWAVRSKKTREIRWRYEWIHWDDCYQLKLSHLLSVTVSLGPEPVHPCHGLNDVSFYIRRWWPSKYEVDCLQEIYVTDLSLNTTLNQVRL